MNKNIEFGLVMLIIMSILIIYGHYNGSFNNVEALQIQSTSPDKIEYKLTKHGIRYFIECIDHKQYIVTPTYYDGFYTFTTTNQSCAEY